MPWINNNKICPTIQDSKNNQVNISFQIREKKNILQANTTKASDKMVGHAKSKNYIK